MGIEIRNTGGDVRGVLVGDPETPDTVKLLQPGETFVASDNAVVTINDGSSVRDRRANADPYGRRTGDPRVDQRQVRRQSQQVNAPSDAPTDNTSPVPTTGGVNSNDPRTGFQGLSGAKSTSTSDGSNVPKDAAGEHTT